MAALDEEADAAVLRDPPLGDVELGHDLDAGHHAADHSPRDRRRGGHDAVDAEPHAQLAALRLEVDVGRAHLDRLGDDRVHQLDDRGVVGGLLEIDDVPGTELVLVVVGLRTASSSRFRRVTSPSMSSREATAGRTSSPVMIAMSSTARTLAGSTIATRRVRSSTKATGTAS